VYSYEVQSAICLQVQFSTLTIGSIGLQGQGILSLGKLSRASPRVGATIRVDLFSPAGRQFLCFFPCFFRVFS
jgi:hypothetical protein